MELKCSRERHTPHPCFIVNSPIPQTFISVIRYNQRNPGLKPTDQQNPDYFHKVVDCQWACPAHTNVPEYIRLIAQGKYTDAYMLNRESNVFPGILGRTC